VEFSSYWCRRAAYKPAEGMRDSFRNLGGSRRRWTMKGLPRSVADALQSATYSRRVLADLQIPRQVAVGVVDA
jgi:hypothetical protein